jgi:hypothetical protein
MVVIERITSETVKKKKYSFTIEPITPKIMKPKMKRKIRIILPVVKSLKTSDLIFLSLEIITPTAYPAKTIRKIGTIIRMGCATSLIPFMYCN